MDELERFEKIERYILGQMSSEELATFEEILLSDKALANEVEQKKFLLQGLKSAHRQDLLSKVETAQENAIHSLDREVVFSTLAFKKLVLQVAIAVVLLILTGLALWWFMPSPSGLQLAINHFDPLPDYLSQKIAANGFDGGTDLEILRQAMEGYNAGDYQRAKDSLSEFFNINTVEDTIFELSVLYYSISLFKTREYKVARDRLQLLETTRYLSPAMQESVKWYLALCYLANDEKASAVKQLEKIDPRGEWGKPARKLLRRL